jgi:enediyne polyketide synthase
VSELESELGSITGLLHGAGINNPKRISDLSRKDFETTRDIKVLGWNNVMEALSKRELKWAVAFGSIIARSGMAGNADYAWANQCMAEAAEDWSKLHSSTKTVIYEWSVWDETGMGAELGLLDILRGRGIRPIPVVEGCRTFLSLAHSVTAGFTRRVLTATYRSLPTFKWESAPTPFGRFAEKTLRFVPGIEVACEAEISLISDPYLKDHVFRGQPVFPTVMALEAFGQLLSSLLGKLPTPLSFRNLRMARPIVIADRESKVVIRVRLRRQNLTTVLAELRSDEELDAPPCFSATLDWATRAIPEFESWDQPPLAEVNVEMDLYERLLFHKGGFRRIVAMPAMDGWNSVAHSDQRPMGNWFGMGYPGKLILGDPGLNDAAIHCHQACRPQYNLLPMGADKIDFISAPQDGPVQFETREIGIDGREILIEVRVTDAGGNLIQIWSGLRMVPVAGSERKGPFSPAMMRAYLQHGIFASQGEKLALDTPSLTIREGAAWVLIREENVDLVTSSAAVWSTEMNSDHGECFHFGLIPQEMINDNEEKVGKGNRHAVS